MTYRNKFVVCIKVNGKVLREQNGEVAIPFSSEYSIHLKNLNSVRAQVCVSVDGEEVSNGWLIIQPNSELNLERSIKNNNLLKGNCFKFIERTSKIEEHRGIGSDDGIVRIEYKYEKVYEPTQKIIHEHHYDDRYYPNYPYYPYYPWPQPIIIDKTYPWNCNSDNFFAANVQTTTYVTPCNAQISSVIGSIYNSAEVNTQPQGINDGLLKSAPLHPTQNMMVASCNMVENTAGITVAGSESLQKFYNVSNFECEASEVIILKLIGSSGETKVTKPITVDAKPKCTTCGRINKATSKFCSECGTALVIF
jgi:hypothetical protein